MLDNKAITNKIVAKIARVPFLKKFLENRRLEITISCHDCDYIPKIPDAGKVFEGDGIEYQLMHNGIKVVKGCYHGDWMTKIIRVLKGHHEPQEEKVFYEVLKTVPVNATMIELGSFWAYYSMWFQKEIKSAKNYMIEPVPEKLEKGEKNFELNQMQGVFTNAFIGKESKEEAALLEWDGSKYHIPQVCVDDYIKEHEIPFVYILHSDIQGAEYDMLLGCRWAIKNKKIGYFFISTHEDKHEKCLKFLREYQFQVIAEHSVAESFSADGLIVARAECFDGVKKVEVSKRNKGRWTSRH